jgi:catechol 2,3-dioxygenase-like lactoylglutathione lyase family enzyme
MIQINGMAHIILTVSSFERALSFYGQFLPFLGLKQVFQGENFAYWVGGRTALGIQRCDNSYRSETFVQSRVGLHHLCFRARSREDIEKATQFLRELGADCSWPAGGGLGAWILLRAI